VLFANTILATSLLALRKIVTHASRVVTLKLIVHLCLFADTQFSMIARATTWNEAEEEDNNCDTLNDMHG
jgi:hypothetical protein